MRAAPASGNRGVKRVVELTLELALMPVMPIKLNLKKLCSQSTYAWGQMFCYAEKMVSLKLSYRYVFPNGRLCTLRRGIASMTRHTCVTYK